MLSPVILFLSINPIFATFLFRYPLKTLEKLLFLVL